MAKTDKTKYLSESAIIEALDPSYNTEFLESVRVDIASNNLELYSSTLAIAKKHVKIISDDMVKRGYPPLGEIEWQANNNRNNNGSRADAVFLNHPVGGISVKFGSDIIGNFGTKQIDALINRPKGEDLFRFLAPEQFDALLSAVITSLLDKLDTDSPSWTAERDDNYGKYSITKIDVDLYELTFDKTKRKLSRQELLTQTTKNKDGTEKKLPGRYNRVFGDFYQQNKKMFELERDRLYLTVHPQIRELLERCILNDKEQLCVIGGFTLKPYYCSDLKNDKVYYVPSMYEVLELIKIEEIKIAATDDEDKKSFGSGVYINYKISLSIPKSYTLSSYATPNYATIDYYVCYNSGTFNRGPVIKHQNFQGKENLWDLIYYTEDKKKPTKGVSNNQGEQIGTTKT
jgi:hypothetical protein